MAELKWTNVNDSGANSALSNYLNANKEFRKSLMGIGTTLSDFTDVLQKGDAENNNRIRDDITNSILNQAAGIQSQEDMNKYLSSGALDNNPLRQQYGWFVNMDAINRAKNNLPQYVLNRAQDIDSSRAYNPEVLDLQKQLNEALGRRDNAAAQKIQEKLSGLTSLSSSSANAQNISQLTKDIDDRDLQAIESNAKATEAVNNATLASTQANQQLQATLETIAPLLIDSNGNNLLDNGDGSIKPITIDLINKSSLDPEAKAQYTAQLVQAQQSVMQAQAHLSQTQAISNDLRKHFGKDLIDYGTQNNAADVVLNRANASASQQNNQTTSSSDSTSNGSNSTDNSNGKPTTTSNENTNAVSNNDKSDVVTVDDILKKVQKIQNTNANTNTNTNSQNTTSQLSIRDEVSKLPPETTGQEFTQALVNSKTKKDMQDKQEKINSETNNGSLAGVNQTLAKMAKWDDTTRPVSLKAFRESLKGEELKAFDQANARTGGILANYVQARISGADTEAWDEAEKLYDQLVDLASNNQKTEYATAKLGENTDPATTSYIASAIASPDKITVKDKTGKDVTLFSDTSEKSREANKANFDKLMMDWYAKQGWWDGTNPKSWLPDRDKFRDRINQLISEGVDPVAIYSMIQEMDARADGAEVSASTFENTLGILEKEKDNLKNWKYEYQLNNKNLANLKNNGANKLLFMDNAIAQAKNGTIHYDDVLEILKKLRSPLKGYLGSAAQTKAEQQETIKLLQQVKDWANGISPSKKQNLTQDIKNNAYGFGYGYRQDLSDAEIVKERNKSTQERQKKLYKTALPKEVREALTRIMEIGTPNQIKEITDLFGVKR